MSDYKFKFVDENDTPVSTIYDISVPIVEMNRCLESEGVSIGLEDMLKAYDIFLRIIGLGRSNDDSNDKLGGINSIVGHIKVMDPIEKLKTIDKTDEIEGIKDVYRMINDIAEGDKKFDDVENVINHVETLIKEFTIFTNDIFEIAGINVGKRNDRIGYVDTYSFKINKFMLAFMAMFDIELGLDVIHIISNVLSDTINDAASVILDTFTDEIRTSIIRNIDKENDKDEK